MSSTKSIDFLALPNGIEEMFGHSLQGVGVEPIYLETISTVQTNAITGLLSFTPPTKAGRYKICGVITLTSGTNTGTVGFGLNYTDSQGQAHSQDPLPLAKADGTIVQTGTAANTEWKGLEVEFSIDASGTAISVDTLVTGSVHYTASAYLKQVA